MAVALTLILRMLFITTVTRCDKIGYSIFNGRRPPQYGDVLRPPPPPPISKILPVPFHGGGGRLQRQNKNVGYNYQSPPTSTPVVRTPPINQFKFPSPFYRQYNFNFVPQPQPFSTTPSPSLFQKVSGWLFPSVQTSYDNSLPKSNSAAPNKKKCNPCNLVPWIPLIKYNNVDAKNVQLNLPTYGPPSPTALNNFQNGGQHKPQQFKSQILSPIVAPGVPHATYGVPSGVQNINPPVDVNVVSTTYGPPSATQAIEVKSQSPVNSNILIPSTSYELPNPSYDSNALFNPHTTSFLPVLNAEVISNSYNLDSSTYSPSSSSYATPSPSFSSSTPSSIYGVPLQFDTEHIDVQDYPKQDDIEVFNRLGNLREQKLPKTSPPTVFRNSYGEPIKNPNIFDIPYPNPASAIVAASSKIKTKVLPEYASRYRYPNSSVALANPAPFSINKGRNIHTLQPVALPNLSVSPLPPIFNARPFRTLMSPIMKNIIQQHLFRESQTNSNNVQIQESIPVAEYTHSVDYPATFIQAPVIDIDAPKVVNQTKAYRNIPNGYIIDEPKDISSQASEDHISATNTNFDSSFESTGTGIGNDLYDSGPPTDMKQSKPFKQKTSFADLREFKDEDIDKYRTDSNLQDIDSPLLYLKPSVPHKSNGNFVLAISTPNNEHDYEIYDDLQTTTTSSLSTLASGWEESRNDINHELSPPVIEDNVYQQKVVQIIIPYTRNKENLDNIQTAQTISHDWSIKQTEEYQPRKVPTMTEESEVSRSTENYKVLSTSTEAQSPIITTNYDSDESNPPTAFSDLYDVKEPPFDIIKLQHTIDSWTQLEYSKQFEQAQQNLNDEKYAKQIPDDFFTTTTSTNYDTEKENYDFYDHEVSGSIQHSIRDDSINVTNKLHKVYNTIDRSKSKDKSDDVNEMELSSGSKFHIYKEASSFRASSSTTITTPSPSTTTTPAPWDKLQLSISPHTNEKVYVVTSKPWRELRNVTAEWYVVEPLEPKQAADESDGSLSDDLPFKSPRFLNRPPFGFTSAGNVESTKTDSSNVSKGWYQSINAMESKLQSNITMLPVRSQHNTTTNLEKNIMEMETTEAHYYSDSDV